MRDLEQLEQEGLTRDFANISLDGIGAIWAKFSQNSANIFGDTPDINTN